MACLYLTPKQDDCNQELRVCLTTEARRHTRYPQWPQLAPATEVPAAQSNSPLKRSDASSVYRVVCWMLRCPKYA